MISSPNSAPGHLAATGLSVRLSGEARPVLRDLEIEVEGGGVTGVAGRSGAGKSTLLHTICGLIPWLRPAEMTGDIVLAGESIRDLDPGQRAHLIATCLDRPDAQLFLATAGQEITAACRLHRFDAEPGALASTFGVKGLMDRRITELSSGQRQRVALACAFAASSRPVVLDEPTAHLDEDGVSALRSALAELVRGGGSSLVAEQAGWRLASSVGSWRRLEGGCLQGCAPPESPGFSAPSGAGHRVVLACKELSVHRGDTSLLENVDLELHEGEVVLLTGANGAGKSTLAEILAGTRRPARGKLKVDGRVTLMLPSAGLQLFQRTVAGEVAATRAVREECARVLRRHRLEHLAARAPWTLSRGEGQRLVHATLDLLRPAVMIVDEPAQGLDLEDLAAFVDLVHRRAEKGRAYLIISHRPELAGAAHRQLEIRDRSLVEVGP